MSTLLNARRDTREQPPARTPDLSQARPEWDYSEHADAYLARPDYPAPLIERLAALTGVSTTNGRIVEIGAGTGNMTLGLAHLGNSYIAVEPNDAMRTWGQKRTSQFKAQWRKGTAEATTLETGTADWIMAAQCFDTFEPTSATRELHRVAAPGARLTVLWNHRVWNDDPLEAQIERLVSDRLGGYKRGVRRVDPTAALTDSGLFADAVAMEEPHSVVMDPERYVMVWRSVRTLRVQAGAEGFETLLADIRRLIDQSGVREITVRYVCRAWTVRRVDR
jgi:SAM-dependent methyltransferase